MPKYSRWNLNVTPEDNYNDYWKEIVENPDGSVNKEQLAKELWDFDMVADFYRTVLEEATYGATTKVNVLPSSIIALMRDGREIEEKNRLIDALKDILEADEPLDDNLLLLLSYYNISEEEFRRGYI